MCIRDRLGQSAFAKIPANNKGLAYPGARLVGFRMMRGTANAAHTLKMKEMRVAYLPEASAPAIADLTVEGEPYIGKTVSASYTFIAYPGEGASLYQWYSCDTENGLFIPVVGANAKEFQIPE